MSGPVTTTATRTPDLETVPAESGLDARLFGIHYPHIDRTASGLFRFFQDTRPKT